MKRLTLLAFVLFCLLAISVGTPAPLYADGATTTVVYVVRFGDTLGGIAKAFGTTVQAIAARNGITNVNRIFVGQRLVIVTTIPTPPPSTIYIVRRGDTLSAIAFSQGTTVAALVRANGLLNPNLIFVGQRLVIPRPTLIVPSPRATFYAVQAGETLSSIAAKFGVSPTAILIANNLRNASMIFTGQVLIIPAPTVQPPSNEPPPPPPSPQPAVCTSSVNITAPVMNETLGANQYVVYGTADVPPGFDSDAGFSYYKVEVGEGEQPIIFQLIGSLRRVAVSTGPLENWDASGLASGVYILRLTVVDTRGQFPPPCEVRVVIQR